MTKAAQQKPPTRGRTKFASKSEAIREALEQVDGKPSAAAKLMREWGYKCSAQYVSVVKSSDKKKALTNELAAAAASPAPVAKQEPDLLAAVCDLCDAVKLAATALSDSISGPLARAGR